MHQRLTQRRYVFGLLATVGIIAQCAFFWTRILTHGAADIFTALTLLVALTLFALLLLTFFPTELDSPEAQRFVRPAAVVAGIGATFITLTAAAYAGVHAPRARGGEARPAHKAGAHGRRSRPTLTPDAHARRAAARARVRLSLIHI